MVSAASTANTAGTANTADTAGDSYRTIGSIIFKPVNEVGKIAQRGFANLADLTSNMNGLSSLVKFTSYSAQIYGHSTGNSTMFASFLGALGNATDMNDATMAVSGLKDVTAPVRRSVAASIGTWSFFAVGVGSTASLLRSVSLIELGSISSKIGEIPSIGGALASIPLGIAITSAATLGFTGFAMDAAQKLVRETDGNTRSKIRLNLAWYVSEIVLGLAILSGAATSPAILALGLTAGGLGCLNFLYGKA